MERAILVSIKLKSQDNNLRIEDIALELEELARTAGVDIVKHIFCIRQKPTPNLFIGRGKTEEIAYLCKENLIDTVIFSEDLTGTQQRNLEEIIQRKTIDRTQLILDIFAKHAMSPEGKIQVELAQLQYLMPRLVGKGILLSRLGGGIGTRGPGEKKLEIDRRRIRQRIEKLKEELEKIQRNRTIQRKRRKENQISTIVLVGYTNAGKTSLLNLLTQSNQLTDDGLFTTLDTLSRVFILPNGEKIILSDTVGFLQGIPHSLIEAFKATLEEIREADLLIHVLDASSLAIYEKNKVVLKVLEELGSANKPMITVLNKIDLVDNQERLRELKDYFPEAVMISVKFKQNIEELIEKIQDFFAYKTQEIEVFLSHNHMNWLELFYREGKMKKIEYLSNGMKINVILPKTLIYKLLQNNDIGKTIRISKKNF